MAGGNPRLTLLGKPEKPMLTSTEVVQVVALVGVIVLVFVALITYDRD